MSAALTAVAVTAAGTAAWLLTAPRARYRPAPRRVARSRASGTSPGGPVAGPSLRLRLAVAAGAGGAVLLLLPGALGAGLAFAATWLGWRRSAHLEPRAERRRREAVRRELPHVVDLVLAAVSSGAAPGAALALVADLVEPEAAAELAFPVARLGLGADPVVVWEDLSGHPQLGRLGEVLHLAADSGAPVADALRRLAEDLRGQLRSEVEERVRQVEVRAAVPLGVCLLPAFVVVGVVPLVAGSVSGLTR